MKALSVVALLFMIVLSNGNLVRRLTIPKMQTTCVYEHSLVTIIETIDRIQFLHQTLDLKPPTAPEQEKAAEEVAIQASSENTLASDNNKPEEGVDESKSDGDDEARKQLPVQQSVTNHSIRKYRKRLRPVGKQYKNDKSEAIKADNNEADPLKEFDKELSKLTNNSAQPIPELARIARSLKETLKPLKKNIDEHNLEALMKEAPKASPTWQEEVENCLLQYKMLQDIIEFESKIRPKIEQDFREHGQNELYYQSRYGRLACFRFVAVLFLFGSIFALFALWAVYVEENGTVRRFTMTSVAPV